MHGRTPRALNYSSSGQGFSGIGAFNAHVKEPSENVRLVLTVISSKP